MSEENKGNLGPEDPAKGWEEMYAGMQKVFLQNSEAMMKNLPNMIHSFKDSSQAYLEFTKSLGKKEEISKHQTSYFDYLQQNIDFWKRTVQPASQQIPETNGDKRFSSPEWKEPNFFFDFIKHNYLFLSKFLLTCAEQAAVDENTRKKLVFYTQQYLNAISPSNFFATNPEAQKLFFETKGESLRQGMENLMNDLKSGRVSQTDFSAFEVGKNLALTPGQVVFENDILQLIQYSPSTEKTRSLPLLIVPPIINKYYILDLDPQNSFAKYAVDAGFTVFMISWCVPMGDQGNLTFDDYVSKGVLECSKVVCDICGTASVNAVGYCIGGTILGTSLAILADRKDNRINSATFLATMLDFSDIGALGAIVDRKLVDELEPELMKGKLLDGKDMTSAFNLARSNDLIWYFVVNNYLKGKTPAPHSILYWTNDNTNLPGKMYGFYLRNLIIENKLSKKDALSICDTPIDLGKIKTPSLVIGTREDHISPCGTAFTTTNLFSGPAEYVLGESGHVAGIVNPPARKKYGYWITPDSKVASSEEKGRMKFSTFQEFLNQAGQQKGSWWEYWAKWLHQRSGEWKPAPTTTGNKQYKPIEPAPGRYVKVSLYADKEK